MQKSVKIEKETVTHGLDTDRAEKSQLGSCINLSVHHLPESSAGKGAQGLKGAGRNHLPELGEVLNSGEVHVKTNQHMKLMIFLLLFV